MTIGEAEIMRSGKDIAILAIGNMVYPSLKAADELAKKGINAEVVNMRFVKPLDEKLLLSICDRFRHILTVEDHSIVGGFGSAVTEFITSRGYNTIHIKRHGIPDHFIEHGTIPQLHSMLKLDAPGIAEVAEELFNSAIHQSTVMEEAGAYGRNSSEKT